MSKLQASRLSAPMAAMIFFEPGCTGSFETSSFHGLSAGKMLHPAICGTLVLTGMPTGNHVTGPIGRLARLWLTSRLGRGRKLVFFICKPNRPNLATMRELIEEGKVHPAVDRVYPLGEIADALETMGEGHVQGKLVVRID